MRWTRLAVTAAAVMALVPVSATAASASASAPPANDLPGGTKALTLGQTYKENTTQATTGDLDAKLNEMCGAPYTNASVWFKYTPKEAGAFVIDMSASDYTGGFMVMRGKISPDTMMACGPTSLGIKGKAGVTYFILAFSDTQQIGGNLVLSLEAAPPKPTMSVTLDPTGKAYPNGTAQLSGTYTCTNGDYVELYGDMTQVWKRVKITGYFDTIPAVINCDGTPQPWKTKVKSSNGLFAAGSADVKFRASACGPIACKEVRVKQPVTLRGGGTAAQTAAGSVPLARCGSTWAAASAATQPCARQGAAQLAS